MRLQFIVCKVLQREAYYCAYKSSNIVDVVLVEQGLHNEPKKLNETLQGMLDNTIDIQDNKYDATLLGYGLCSNGILGLHSKIPLIVPKGHDCITLLLGSKTKYKDYFDSHKGVYWYSPGWIETDTQPGKKRFEKTKREYVEKYGEDNAEYLMEMEQGWMKEYTRATFIDWGFPDSKEHEKFTKECAEFMGWGYDKIEGDASLMQKMVDGQWNDDEFLVVQPGGRISEDLTTDNIIRSD